jgi:predicted ATP-dependent protease
VEAMKFGMGIRARGYNIFAVGPPGTGKRTVVTQYFEQQAKEAPVPPDWCYVNNFEESHRPKVIQLPAGKGIAFRQDVDELVDSLSTALSAAFESEEYQARRQSIASELQERQSEYFQNLQEKAQEKGVALLRTPAGLAFAPIREGEVMSSDEVQELPEEERKQMESQVEELQTELQKILRQVPSWQRETQDKLRELNREMANFAVGGLIDELQERYSDFPEIVEHLDGVQKDIVENARDFLAGPQQEEGNLPAALRGAMSGQSGEGGSLVLRRYRVNLLVDHSQAQGAPVIHEDNPTYQNLVGRVEHIAQMGALVTDFNLIKPGALHRANGGFLIIDARKILTQPYAWEGLKRALRSREIRIESVGQMLSLISTISLEPETIPMNTKVALLGEPMLYYLLYQLDPDFPELFKVQADFATSMDRNDENQELYARMIASLARREELMPLDRTGVARVIEHGARIVSDTRKVSVQMRDIADLLREASYWASQNGHDAITAADVQEAIDAQIYRSDQLRERVEEAIERDIVLIDARGDKIGQINGLSVIQLGNFSFGRPNRITARVWMGKGNVVDIEREVELGGPIHSKGSISCLPSWESATRKRSRSRSRPA